MPVVKDLTLRAATPPDGRVLAELMNAAGEGIPAWLWSQNAAPGEAIMEYGARRVGADEGAFSYTNTKVIESGGVIAGMLLGYRLPDPYPEDALDDCPAVVRPMIELESQAPGAWYVNAVAVVESFRGCGVGSRLMALADLLAVQSGSDRVCLIVAVGNTHAVRLYRRLGYRTTASRTIVPCPNCPHEGRWLLMEKALVE